MSKTLYTSQICEMALRKIGAYSINDSAANAEELGEAAAWLDLIVAFLVATERITWLVEDTVTVALTADQASYSLETALGSSYPSDGVLFITDVLVTDGTTDDPIDIITRKDYGALTNKTASGKPHSFYIDRLSGNDPVTFRPYPIPAISTLSLKLVFQKGAPNLADSPGQTIHGMPVGWQFWMVKAVAAEIGNGPVRRLPRDELLDIVRETRVAFDRLQATQNRERFIPTRAQPHGA